MFNPPCQEEGEEHCLDCIEERNEHCCWCGEVICPEHGNGGTT